MNLLWLVVLLPIVFWLLLAVYVTGGWFGLAVVAVAVLLHKLVALSDQRHPER